MGGDDPELFDDEPDDLGPFSDAGSARRRQIAEGELKRPGGKDGNQEPRKGRPRGSLNRKTADFERYYAAKGFDDPLVAMARFLTADPVELQAWFVEHERTIKAIGKKTGQAVPSLIEIIKEQHTVASQLAPYLHGKKPVQVEIIDERLPQLVINLGTNQIDQMREIGEAKAMQIGQVIDHDEPEKANEINDAGVRHEADGDDDEG